MYYLLVGLGGAIGSIIRYSTGVAFIQLGWVQRPYLATLAVNLAGSFVLGVLSGLLTIPGKVSHEARLLVGTGICGGFITFSTLSTEGILLLQTGKTVEAILYLAGSLLGGLVVAALGYRLGLSG